MLGGIGAHVSIFKLQWGHQFGLPHVVLEIFDSHPRKVCILEIYLKLNGDLPT